MNELILVQEIGGMNNILTNLFIDWDKTCVTGAFDRETGLPSREVYMRHFNDPTYTSWFPAPTFYANFDKDKKFYEHEQVNLNRDIKKCKYVVARGVVTKGKNRQLQENVIPRFAHCNTTVIGNIYTTNISYQIFQKWTQQHHKLKNIEDLMTHTYNGLFEGCSAITCGYKNITLFDVEDLFISRKIPELKQYIQNTYRISHNDFHDWIIDKLYQKCWPLYSNLKYDPEIDSIIEKFNQKLNDFKVINSETIDKYI